MVLFKKQAREIEQESGTLRQIFDKAELNNIVHTVFKAKWQFTAVPRVFWSNRGRHVPGDVPIHVPGAVPIMENRQETDTLRLGRANVGIFHLACL